MIEHINFEQILNATVILALAVLIIKNNDNFTKKLNGFKKEVDEKYVDRNLCKLYFPLFFP